MTVQSPRSITLDVAAATVLTRRRFVTVNASGNAASPAANGDAVGIVLEDSGNGDTAAVPVAVLDGAVLEVEASGAIAAGAPVASDADGKAAAAAGTTTRVLGYAKTAASADGDIMEIVASKAGGFAAQA